MTLESNDLQDATPLPVEVEIIAKVCDLNNLVDKKIMTQTITIEIQVEHCEQVNLSFNP